MSKEYFCERYDGDKALVFPNPISEGDASVYLVPEYVASCGITAIEYHLYSSTGLIAELPTGNVDDTVIIPAYLIRDAGTYFVMCYVTSSLGFDDRFEVPFSVLLMRE